MLDPTAMQYPSRAYVLASVGALILVGCSDSDPASPSPDDAATADTADTADTGARTLENCDTRIDPGVPAFFATYFRCVTITLGQGTVIIETDDLPPHPSNYYGADDPNYVPFDTSRGPQYRANPNLLVAQAIRVEIPLEPVARGLLIDGELVDGVLATSPDEYPLGPVGVALDSVALFNPLAAPGDDIDDERFTFDAYNAHPTQNGTYHYHTTSPGPLEVLAALGLVTDTTPGQAAVELYGIMCDGTVVLGCTELDGAPPNDGDFDRQNGHVHDLVDMAGQVVFEARYHTHICPERYTAHRFTPEIAYYDTCVRR